MAKGIDPGDFRKEAKNAVVGAAITVLSKLYKNPNKPNANASAGSVAALAGFIDSTVRSYTNENSLDVRSPGYLQGVKVATAILGKLEIKSTDLGADAGSYMPYANHPYFFDDDPSHPVRPRPVDPNNPALGSKVTRPYHGPMYGKTAAVFATTMDFKIADPYVVPSKTMKAKPQLTDPNFKKYLESVEDVHRMGGVEGPTTKRSPAQTASALFWAYDGANLIGTPPRLYNQIIRQIAYDNAVRDKAAVGSLDSDLNNAEFARLLALANVAMTDAGIFCWREKYRYELWRPLSGVRQDPSLPAPGGFARPFWRVLGAPATNSNEGGFKPPFPAYPSGHATFGAAAFQIVRRFYHAIDSTVIAPLKVDAGSGDADAQQGTKGDPADAQQVTKGDPSVAQKPEMYAQFHGNDNINFEFISDELNGINRELYQTYDPSHGIQDQAGEVRTRMVISFGSMKKAIFSNAISRIWLGVHWHFDAFAGEDIMEPFIKACGKGEDINPHKPETYEQLYQCAKDGSTLYSDVDTMNWFKTTGTREGLPDAEGNPTVEEWWYGGVPLGMLIADDIFSSGMQFVGSVKDLGCETPRQRTQADAEAIIVIG